jgi:hypothetical protein
MRVDQHRETIIDKTIRTSVLIDAFWERWLVHGVDAGRLARIKPGLRSLDSWQRLWTSEAQLAEREAGRLAGIGQAEEAELSYRLAALYYNLTYWIYPERCPDKAKWYRECVRAFADADAVSAVPTRYEAIHLVGTLCKGRVRVPDHPAGCIIIVNPIDSSKEELFAYESDFIRGGFATISFDGPGQGETYMLSGLRGSKERWERFIDKLIDFAAARFPALPIHLFGTSLGASWAIYGSRRPEVAKTVAVSPTVEFVRMHFPAYFLSRMDHCCNLGPGTTPIPDYEALQLRSPVQLYHGRKDTMVPIADMRRLYELLPAGKSMIEYEEEGHCCNHKLAEIRQRSISWFKQS